MNSRFFKQIFQSPLFVIALLICAANWQLLLGFKSLHWDVLNFWHPWRYFIAECYTNGLVPQWDPYTQAGYPVHGDLQGPAYNPEAIISSFLFPINVYFFNYLFVAYLILGAWGFYKLSLLFNSLVVPSSLVKENMLGAAFTGLAYSLSGYTIGHGHYLYILISIALIPWIYYYFLKHLQSYSFSNSCKLSIFLFLQITAGNPSFLIVSVYILGGVWVVQTCLKIKHKEYGLIKQSMYGLGTTFLLVCAMALPVFINAYFILPETTRGHGIALSWAADERYALRNLFSFFTPLVSFERELHTEIQQPIFDSYLGIGTLFFSIVGLIKYRSNWIRLFGGIAVLAFFLSLGLRTPLFGWFFHILPLFNVFRMPRLIFIYSQMFLLLMASLGIHSLSKNVISFKWIVRYSLVFVFFGACSVLYFRFLYSESGIYSVGHNSLWSFLVLESQSHKAFASLCLSLFLLIPALFFYYKKKFLPFVGILILDILLNYNLGAEVRIFSQTDAVITQSYIQHCPKGFAPPENLPACQVRSITSHFNELWLNESVFIKQPSYLNDNNFELSNYMKLYTGKPAELNYFIHQPLAFFVDSLVSTISDTLPPTNRTLALTDSEIVSKYKSHSFNKSPSDTICIQAFEPQHFLFRVSNKKATGFVLQQNKNVFWRVSVDGKPILPEVCFHSFPFIPLSGGQHLIEFNYQVPWLTEALITSLAIFSLLVLFVLYKMPYAILTIPAWLMVLGFCLFSFFFSPKNKENPNPSILVEKARALCPPSAKVWTVLNTRDALFPVPLSGLSVFNFLYPNDLALFSKQLNTTKADCICLISDRSYYPDELSSIVSAGYGSCELEKKTSWGLIQIFKRGFNKQTVLYDRLLDLPLPGLAPLELIKSKREYSKALIFKASQIGARKNDLLFAEAEIESQLSDPKGLCLSIEKDGKNKKFLAAGLIHNQGGKTQMLSFYYRLPENTEPEDEIKVFLWNDNQQPVLVKSMRLRVIRSTL